MTELKCKIQKTEITHTKHKKSNLRRLEDKTNVELIKETKAEKEGNITIRLEPKLKKKICRTVGFIVSADHKWKSNTVQRETSTWPLPENTKTLSNRMVMVIPNVIDTLGTVPKDL